MSSGKIDFVDLSPQGSLPLEEGVVRLHTDDQVGIARRLLNVGTTLMTPNGTIPVRQFITDGHKIALQSIRPGEAVRRYGQVIGFASRAIAPGEHVHTHNLSVAEFARDYAFGVDVRPVRYVPEAHQRTFRGYRRADGRVGTRSYIAVISTVNCSAHTAREIAHTFTREQLADFPNIDGVIALAHPSGCGQQYGGDGYQMLQRTLAGMAVHPNISGYIIVGLGCEINQIGDLIANYHLSASAVPPNLNIQESGGVRRTIEAGVAAIRELLPDANNVERTPQPVAELMVALQCGGSDGWSGVTANPALGVMADRLVEQGGTVVLSETPEIYGAEHLLTRRAINEAVGHKLVAKIRWWEDYTRRHGAEIDNNPSPGNKAGGLTTIYEKSLGAAAKGGSTPLVDVVDYAEPIRARGFVFMDTPGYDPVSVTGQVAGGCNMVMFTTGRGSCFGFKPAPSIKICTNSATYQRMTDDMDIDAGRILDGVSIDTVAGEMFEKLVEVASGTPSRSEAQGIGEHEFNPWIIGATL
jgi:altronate hydrolase